MKLSISLSDEDVAALDRYAEAAGVPSRSAAIQRAIRQVTATGLDEAYTAAWDEWESSGGAGEWERTAGDGSDHVAR